MSQQLRKRLLTFSMAVTLVVFGFAIGMGVLTSSATDNIAAEPLEISQINPTLTPFEQSLNDVYTNVSPSVVAINVVAERIDPVTGREESAEGSGSGFVVDTNGHIVTNAHVVAGAQEVVVNFFDGLIVRAEIVGIDPDSDLAVIRVDVPAERLLPVEFGDINDVIVGQRVVALGSPFGQRWTLTTGIVSAVNRRISGFQTNFSIGSAIQTDAPINPGNSGGPLLNLEGQVVGVNSQILSESGSNSGVGFAIPSDLTVRVANDLIEVGFVRYSYIGIGVGIGGVTNGDVNLAMIEALNLPSDLRGVVVGNILEGGPAAQAGLVPPTGSFETGVQSADIITAIDGNEISGFNDLVSYLARNTVPGQTVQLTVYRDGGYINLPLTLADRPN